MRTLRIMTAIALLGLAATSSALADGATSTELTTDRVDSEETSFGDLTGDALCAAAGTTIALAPAVIFKPGQIKPGPVSAEAASGLLHDPGENWAVVELTGDQIRSALERSVSFAPTPRTFFLQVSGLKVVYSPRAPRGRKIKSLTVGAQEISDAAKYEVAMPESLAEGASGYFTIFGSSPKIRTGSGGLARAIASYVADEGTVSYTGQGRIVVGE